MSDENLQEWEEYDARMLDDSPVVGGTRATQRSKSEFRHAPIESPAVLEGPFLLGNAGELASEAEGIAWETAGSPSVGASPQFRTEETELATHNGGCGCGRSTGFPGSSEKEVSINSLSESQVPMTRSDIIDRAFKDSRDSLVIALGHLRKLRDDIKALPVTSDPAFNSAFVNLSFKHKRNIAVLLQRLKIVPPDPSGAQFRQKLDGVIDLCDRNLALGKTILDAGSTGLCVPSNPCDPEKRPYLACSDANQPDPKTHVCDMFFTASKDLQRDVITHEYFHLVGLGADIKVDNTADAMRNANTIAQIVALLTDRKRQKNSDGQEPAKPPLPLDKEMQEFETELQKDALYGSEDRESLVDEAGRNGWRAESLEFDPYADIRSALRPEHASLAADELTVIVGLQPTLIALHRMLASPEPQQAALALLLGGAGRRSAQLHGSDVPIPSYLRLLSRLCREAAEQTEAEAGQSETGLPLEWTWIDSSLRGLALVPADTDGHKRIRCMLGLVLKLREKAEDGYLDYQNWKNLFYPPGFTGRQKEEQVRQSITHLEKQLATRANFGPATEILDGLFLANLESIDEVITRSMRDFKLNAEAGGAGASVIIVRGWKLIQLNRINSNSIYSCYASYHW
jgi:hypothetical protein